MDLSLIRETWLGSSLEKRICALKEINRLLTENQERLGQI